MRTLPPFSAAGLQRLVIVALAAAWWWHAPSLASAAEASPAAQPVDAELAAFFKQHCVRCHGEQKAENGLRIDQLDADLSRAATFARWHKLLQRLQSGEMPPDDEPQPAAPVRTAAVGRIAALLDEASAGRQREGRVVLRRLNRVEYENTVRDLFQVRVSVKDMLPEDSVALGFDNIGAALNISPVLMERYLEAADAVLDAALAPVPQAEQKLHRLSLLDAIPGYFLRAVYVRDDGVVLFRSEGSATALNQFQAPVPGRYRVRISAYGYQSDVPVPLAVLAGNFRSSAGAARYVGFFDAPPREPGVIEFETRLESPRETIKIVPADLPKVYLRPEAMEKYPGSGLCVQWIEIEGPFAEPSPAPSYKRVFGDVDPRRGTLADAEKLLRELLPRAFRRPAADAELQPYLALVARSLEAGQSFEQALRAGIKAVLCSPQFLYLRERPGQLDDYALASRLSYFLWSTMPDDELLALASRGELRSAGVLRGQVERMLKHAKGRAFTENFVGQWLSLRDIKFTTPDVQLYPEYNDLLEWSMLQETQLFFDELLQNDLSVLNFVDSDFTLLNQRLARHYGIEGVQGVALRKVPLKSEHHRGGVLTHAAVLKVTANGTTTSPVLRGVWVLDRMIGRPAAPPPANVPAIEPDIRGATTIREQLARHRQIESCAACHAQIDPPGFALESYDVIGGWREHYRALNGRPRENRVGPIAQWLARVPYGDGPAVEAGDVLPDGRKFADIGEFKQLLLADPDQIARCLATKLMVYATGHGLEYGDQQQIEQIVREAKKANYGLRTMVHLVVASELFRAK
jgi:mono/diheme cytochrome c family protein